VGGNRATPGGKPPEGRRSVLWPSCPMSCLAAAGVVWMSSGVVEVSVRGSE